MGVILKGLKEKGLVLLQAPALDGGTSKPRDFEVT
jgi:hypothetical protein